MASPQAHIKLKRILKGWVISNPNLVYWQGLDSLCAPFLYLNFNCEEVAFGCLTNFVNKYAPYFFLKDNSAVIHEYLTVFSHLIAFHDPELANHFEKIDFRPDLYAIPWFLTMFAHVFPLQKIFHLWDTLLLGSSAFPLCIGVAILKQLRTILLNSDFNECILLFSELPEINIIKCVSDSIELFCWTPTSCLYREHSETEAEKNQAGNGFVDEFDMSPIGLEQMRAELCPRISTRDILNLYDVKSSKLVLIDVRSTAEFAQGHIFNSRNVSFENVNFIKLEQLVRNGPVINSAPSETDSTAFLAYLLQQNKNLVKIILGSVDKHEHAIEMANTLVRLGMRKVCILHRGIECFHSTKIWQQQ
jgi:TBC domain-containing protein kinase-like protein